MAFSAGALLLVVVAEMVPGAVKERKGVLFVMLGYVLMMTLDEYSNTCGWKAIWSY